MRRAARRIHPWTVARRLTAGAFLALIVLGRFDWFPWFRGTTSGTRLLDVVPFVDPLAALEVVVASRTVPGDVLLGAGMLLAAAVLLGPVFCGWVCPLGLLLDLNQALRRALRRRPRTERAAMSARGVRPSRFRYVVLGGLLGFAAIGGLPLFQILSPINITARAVSLVVGPGLLLVAAIVLVEHVHPRLWCRGLCPLGALYGLVGRFGILRIRLDTQRKQRTPCHQCTRSCPMGIPVVEDYVVTGRASIDHPDCIRCGECADVCPRDILRLGFRAPRDRERSSPHEGCPSCGTSDGHATTEGDRVVSLPIAR